MVPGVPRRIRAQHAGEPIAAAKFCKDQIAVRTQCFAQCRDLKLQVLCRYDDARPHPADELFFSDKRAIGFHKDHEDIEGARAKLDRPFVGEQLPPAQQHTETAEFEIRAGGYPA
jgi:hypothetical protein